MSEHTGNKNNTSKDKKPRSSDESMACIPNDVEKAKKCLTSDSRQELDDDSDLLNATPELIPVPSAPTLAHNDSENQPTRQRNVFYYRRSGCFVEDDEEEEEDSDDDGFDFNIGFEIEIDINCFEERDIVDNLPLSISRRAA